MALTGYDAQKVKNLRSAIDREAQRTGNGIISNLNTYLINPISRCWYAPEAKTYFESFKTLIASLGTDVTEAFDSYRKVIEAAANNWAENTGGEKIDPVRISDVHMDLNITSIQAKDYSGRVGIDVEEAKRIAGNLSNIENSITRGLNSTMQTLKSESAFLGQNQAAAMQTCFSRISASIQNMFKFLTEGDESLAVQINKAANKYVTISQGINSAVSGE